MTSPWQRLEGRAPVNKAAASISSKLIDQENNEPSAVEKINILEHDLLLQKQINIKQNAESERDYDELLEMYSQLSNGYLRVLQDYCKTLKALAKNGLLEKITTEAEINDL